jgi:hypothetical protein
MPSINKLWIPTIVAATVLFFVFLFYAWEHMFGFLTRMGKHKEEKSALEGFGEDDESLPHMEKSKKKHKKKRGKQLDQVKSISCCTSALLNELENIRFNYGKLIAFAIMQAISWCWCNTESVRTERNQTTHID